MGVVGIILNTLSESLAKPKKKLDEVGEVCCDGSEAKRVWFRRQDE